MAKTFNLHFGIQIDGNDYTEVLTKMCNMRQDILNSVNKEVVLRFINVDLDEKEFSAMVELVGINDTSLLGKIIAQIKNGEFDENDRFYCFTEHDVE